MTAVIVMVLSKRPFASFEAVEGKRMSLDMEHRSFRFTSKMRVFYVRFDLLINALLNVTKDGLFHKIE